MIGLGRKLMKLEHFPVLYLFLVSTDYKASQLLVNCTMLIEAYGNNSRAWKEMHFVTVYTPVDTEVRF